MTDTELKEQMGKEWLKCHEDVEYFIREYCYILHPTKNKIKFSLYGFQSDTLGDFTKFDYNIILKSRQMGCTTLVSCYALWLMLFKPGTIINAISLRQDVAKEICSKLRFSHDALPSFLKAKYVEDNRLSITFENNSRIIANATTDRGTVSYALSLLIVDEAALIEEMSDLWASSQPSLSHGGKAIVMSTPRGTGNWFHSTWVGAEAGTSVFHHRKLPWNLHPEHDEEWRRIEGEKIGNPKEASREYDCNFFTSGDGLLSPEVLKLYKDGCSEPIEKRYNNLWIWERPIPGNRYWIAADTATNYGQDFSTAEVFNIDTMNQAAEIQCRMSTYDFGNFLVELATEYNMASLVAERNGVGESTCQSILAKNYKQFVHCSNDSSRIAFTYDVIADDVEPGFCTTSGNRFNIIDKLERFFREEKLQINSIRLMSEMETFVDNGRGMYKAMSDKYHDDLVLATAIGIWVNDSIYRINTRKLTLTKAAVGAMNTSRSQDKHSSAADTRPLGHDNPFYHKNQPGIKQNYWKMTTKNGTSEDLTWLL